MLITINLLPVTQKNERQQKRLNSKILTICIILIAIFIGLSAFLYTYTTTLNLEANSVKQELQGEQAKAKSYSQTETSLKKIATNLNYINTLGKNSIDWNEFMIKFSNIVPEKVKITNLNASAVPTPNIEISGEANSRREAILFLEKIKTTSFFKDAMLKSLDKSSTATTADAAATLTFSISAKIVNTPTKTETK